MTLHEKMQTDYTWVRSHMAEDPKQRTHGYNYLYNKAPNTYERLEMIYRSMGKQYDWEMERFRLARKNIDRGNKRRFTKNALRFFKHPFGYFYWKTINSGFRETRWLTKKLFVGLVLSVVFLKLQSNSVQFGNGRLFRAGKNIEGVPNNYMGSYNKRPYKENFALASFLQYHATPDMIVMNQTAKQNLRKELQLLKSSRIDY